MPTSPRWPTNRSLKVPPVPDLTVAAVNLHNARKPVRWLARHQGIDIAMVSEAQKRRKALRLDPGRRYVTGPAGMGDNDAGRETGILLARNLPDLGGGSERVSTVFAPAPRVGKERWVRTALTEVGGVDIAALSVHPVAAPEALRTGAGRDNPLAARHRDFTDWLGAALAFHTTLGRQVILGGDVNVRQEWKGAAPLQAILRRHDLDGLWDGLDLLMVTPGLRVTGRDVFRDIGSDHPALQLRVKIRRSKP